MFLEMLENLAIYHRNEGGCFERSWLAVWLEDSHCYCSNRGKCKDNGYAVKNGLARVLMRPSAYA
jgi:hypothetical protein